ncbi:MAG: hypothetical protein U1E28_16580 [Beijerinckiaceae bacterium]
MIYYYYGSKQGLYLAALEQAYSGIRSLDSGVELGDLAPRQAMRQKGVAFLEMSSNYYDDLDARYGPAPEVLEALRANRILYDRDADGQFFQIYTRTFEDRLFFEIVQRVGYRGFGASNAPIRLSAQTRELPPGMPRH